ncbi:phosphoglycerate mutase-like protein [Sodiomyces alkalinus F11]|uniref:Phosphoglycerate mutase-like protein n=1 Tax=Sodiomyces alkalinus (strain CBS 110278 / VKM F-3762 / F11) TaxID=1314773 RepID=A0A3N2PXW5_SODAK|nr:phosphoglycerate mutase-like protein [Sodiomyces alkalinus F11]ROT39370.1 phosphoglycerate mutase-like protein [Sodiomyces alkalinus F11]
MGKPRLIILVRHAQSEGNKNRDIHQTIPDHRVKITPEGWAQAYDAGRRLRKLLREDDTLQFFTSPYRRTRETTEGILATLTSDDPEPSPFKRDNINVYDEPRLREQDFGNFQPCSAEMERMWQERADYGHFFYRIPNGESAADAYDRVSGFNESLWRQFGEDDFPSVCVLVTHGLMSRVFLMKWYHFTVEYFEDLRNVNHCEFLIMRKDDESGKYTLENELRTWSQLRRERALLLKEKEDDKAVKCFAPPRRWGGCPDGCNHERQYKRREDLEILRQRDEMAAEAVNGLRLQNTQPQPPCLPSRRSTVKRFKHGSYDSSDSDNDAARKMGAAPPRPVPQIDLTRACEEVVSSPDATPSFISAEDRLRGLQSPHLHVGRDGGGTYSGHASLSNSDVEEPSEDDADGSGRVNGGRGQDRVALLAAQLQKLPTASATDATTNGGSGHLPGQGPVDVSRERGVTTREDDFLDNYGRRLGARANRLGDTHSSDVGSDGGRTDEDHEDDEMTRTEKREKSIAGSVY